MPRFTLPTDTLFFQAISNELVQAVIDTNVSLFKLNLSTTSNDLYGDSDIKDYYNPVTVACIVERSDTQFTQEGFGSDAAQTAEYRFNRDVLKSIGVYPEIGDLIFHNDAFFEIDSVREDQLVGGQTYNKFSIICSTYMIRKSSISVNGIDFTPEPQVVDTHVEQFQEIEYDFNTISTGFASDITNGLFAHSRDLILFDVVSNELVNKVIKTDVLVYKVIVNEVVNIYGETSRRQYYTPLRLSCIIDRQDTQFIQEGFGSDASQVVDFMFNRSMLKRSGYYPEIGDVIYHNDAYFEIDSVREDQLVGGQSNQKFSVICSTFMVRVHSLDIIDVSVPNVEWVDEFSINEGAYPPSGSTGTIGQSGTSGTSGTSGGGVGGSDFVFDTDLIVSLTNNKTFGRFETGDIIPSSGKTVPEIIQMAITEPIAPTISIYTSDTLLINQTSSDISILLTHTINNVGASASTAVLEYRRGGSWVLLSNNISPSYTYIHSTPSVGMSLVPFEYRYTVVDTTGATTSDTIVVTPIYTSPIITNNVVAASVVTPEVNTKREVSNTATNISISSISSNPNVLLDSISLQYRIGSGSWVTMASYTDINNLSFSTTPVLYTIPHNTTSSVSVRSNVIDKYHSNIGSSGVFSNTTTIMFDYFIFYGNVSSYSLSSSFIRSLPFKIFASGTNNFILNTGNTNSTFVIALPPSYTISSVIDLDALNINITSGYIYQGTVPVQVGSDFVNYNIYIMSNAVPYSEPHSHQINIQ